MSTPVIPVNPQGHRVEFTLPSFRADPQGRDFTGEVVLKVDGVELMRTPQIGYGFAWGEEVLGRNPFGHTCGMGFRGWILEGRWTGPRE